MCSSDLRSLSVDACAYPRAAATAGANLDYQVSATPLVTQVSPQRGSTGGGTVLALSVSNLPSGLAPSDLRASIAGVAATVDSVAYDGAGATVGITTGAHGRTSTTNTGRGAVKLTVVATVGTSAASANATYEYIDLWSRSTTWGGGLPPEEGDTVWIQPGQKILYDVSSPRLYMLIIQGEFIFDRTDLTLDANYIFVMGGAFVVGTENEPDRKSVV